MKQVIQNFKTGDLYVDEVAIPGISDGMVLVENSYSLISSGTERGTVKVGQSSLLGKAKQRPDLVAQVLQNIKKEGLKATVAKVKTKLDSLKALGYSTSGVVRVSMDTHGHFKPGDRVACAGQDYASHAEIVSVPQNLVAKIPDNVSFEEASFTTLGAIALQGVRQASPTLGENVCVIGLGLLGQLTCQLLKANGCNVLGIDLADPLIQLAKEISADHAFDRNDPNLISAIQSFTNGNGFDSIIITAASSSNDPIEFSAEIARKKAKVVVVGAVNMNIPRDPHFYRKELDLRMSCSYGPGRYDVNYEEHGNDYPIGYVRWTEQRNMEAFLNLVSQGKINLKPLITHTFDINDATAAYDIVLGKKVEPHIGILLKYPNSKNEKRAKIELKKDPKKQANIGFIGAGSFAQSYLLPNVISWGNASLDTVITSKGITSKNVASKFGFNNSSSNVEDIVNNESIDTVFIATPHNTHAEYTLQSLRTGKNVFVEKPLALSLEELEEIKKVYDDSRGLVVVGFNRRFSSLAKHMRENFKGIGQPLVINIRVNAGFIPKDHWIQNDKVGGGRIVGEICHFVDLMLYLTGSLPKKVYADCIDSSSQEIKNEDNINITLKFRDGSVGNILYLANGDKAMPKEKIEIFGGDMAGVINDFKDGEIFSNNRNKKIKLSGKGHREEVYAFLDAIKKNKPSPIPFEDIYFTTLTTFKILDSIHTGLPQNIE